MTIQRAPAGVAQGRHDAGAPRLRSARRRRDGLASARIAAAPQIELTADDQRPGAGRQDARPRQRHVVELADERSPTSGSSATRPARAAPAISGATPKTYSVAGSGDADKTLRVQVTATNADGSAAGDLAGRPTVVSSRGRPGEHRRARRSRARRRSASSSTAATGTWTGGVRSYAYQWQRCDAQGGSLRVRHGRDRRSPTASARVDPGNTLRVVVTATNLSGSTNAVSSPTALVGDERPDAASGHRR